MVYPPAGGVSFPMGGGGMWSCFPFSSLFLFLPTRSAMSTLASVVSLGSPGSMTGMGSGGRVALEPARCLLGGCGSGAVVSPSETEASRDEGCGAGSMVSARSGIAGTAAARFRLPAEEAGEDMAVVWVSVEGVIRGRVVLDG